MQLCEVSDFTTAQMPNVVSGPNSGKKLKGTDSKTRNTDSVHAAGQDSQSLIEQQLKKIEGILQQTVRPSVNQNGSSEEANSGGHGMAGSVLFNRAEQFKSKLESVLSKSKSRTLASD